MNRYVVPLIAVCAGASILCADAQQLTEAQRYEARDLFKSGMQALVSERYDEAERDFRGTVKIDRTFDAAFYGLGQVYMATERYERAVQAYLDSREAFKAGAAEAALDATAQERAILDEIQALQDLVRSYERMAPSNQGISAIREIERIKKRIRDLQARRGRKQGGPLPIPAGLSLALGSAYFRLNRLADAEREYKAAIEVNPSFGEAHNNLAVVYMLTNRVDEAEQEVKLAEKNGFRVNPRFKEDVKKRREGRL